MKITVVTVGKKHDPLLHEAIISYEKRLKPYCDFRWQVLPNGTVETESASLLKSLKDFELVFLLDEHGLQFTNTQLATSLERAQNNSTKSLAIVIGGAYGVTPEVKSRADAVLSLSKLVLPHQIVRLLVVEQLYRSYTILNGIKYHHQ